MSETNSIMSLQEAATRIAESRMSDVETETPAVEEAPVEETQEIETEAEGADPEPAPDEDPAPVTGDHEDEAGEPDDDPAQEAPSSWPSDRAQEWAELSDSARELILQRESEIQSTLSEKGREAAEARRKADEVMSRTQTEMQQRIAEVDALLPQLADRAKSRWEKVNWTDLARDDPDQYVQQKAEYDADVKAYNEAKALADRARADELKSYNDEQYRRLVDLNPQYQGEAGVKLLRDEAARVQEFASSLDGVTADQLQHISADIFSVLRDAMKYRDALKKTTVKPRQKKPAQKTAPVSSRKAPEKTAKQTRQKQLKRIDEVRTAGGGLNAQIQAAVEARLAKGG